jgi:ribosomal protein S18 acetylase RimI-like enzyme
MTKLNLEPEFETERRSIFVVITTIENAFIQAWIDAGAWVIYSGKEDYWVMTNHTHLLFKIHEEAMHLECISTCKDDRKQGHGSEMMKLTVQCSEESGIPVTLQVANVTGNGYMMMQHSVIGMGMPKKDKIPVGSLPKWYEKFGFTKSPSYNQKNRDMIYTPKKK